jgi:antitoxin component YwqK of YwqJK toxin-antitoxin module|tara:strand:- start:263 stop:910 length:648 start_codon:yes stop_codon:yes gene_type:complete
MSKKIHTIQSSDKKEFDEKVNIFLEHGCELMDGGYEVIKNDDGVVYSQVIVFNNCEVEFWKNRQIKTIFSLNENGKKDVGTAWHENGQKAWEKTFKDERIYRLVTTWHENGQKCREQIYKDGIPNGKGTEYFENGQKKNQGTFKNGKLDGLFENWYENGQKKSTGKYKDGKDDGMFTIWYKNGDKLLEGSWENGEKAGQWINYLEDGTINSVVEY